MYQLLCRSAWTAEASQPAALLLQAVPGEASNMISITCWQAQDLQDSHLKCLVDSLLHTYAGISSDTEVRVNSHQVTKALKAHVAAPAAQGGGGKCSVNAPWSLCSQ